MGGGKVAFPERGSSKQRSSRPHRRYSGKYRVGENSNQKKYIICDDLEARGNATQGGN